MAVSVYLPAYAALWCRGDGWKHKTETIIRRANPKPTSRTEDSVNILQHGIYATSRPRAPREVSSRVPREASISTFPSSVAYHGKPKRVKVHGGGGTRRWCTHARLVARHRSFDELLYLHRYNVNNRNNTCTVERISLFFNFFSQPR